MYTPYPLSVPGGQLPGTTAVLFEVPASAPVSVYCIVVNTGSDATFNLLVTRKNATTSQQITAVDQALAAGNLYKSDRIELHPGDAVSGDASAATQLDYTFSALQYLQ